VQEQAANALRNMRRLFDANQQVEQSLIKNIPQGKLFFNSEINYLFELSLVSTQKVTDKRMKCLDFDS
jgi:hypothetical protein